MLRLPPPQAEAATMDAWSRTSQTVTPEMWKSYEQHVEWLKDAENVKTLREAKELASSREGGKVCCESKQWAPSKIRGEKLRRYLAHVYRCAGRQAEEFLGGHAGRLAAAEMDARRKEDMSRAMLADRGVKTLGEV